MFSSSFKRRPTCAEFNSMSVQACPGLERAYQVYRLAYNGDVAAGQLAVFQGGPSRTGGKAPMSGFIRAERATRKNSRPAAARRVALKMGRRPRCSSVTYRFRYASSCARKGKGWSLRLRALPAAHFERNDITIICETVH